MESPLRFRSSMDISDRVDVMNCEIEDAFMTVSRNALCRPTGQRTVDSREGGLATQGIRIRASAFLSEAVIPEGPTLPSPRSGRIG